MYHLYPVSVAEEVQGHEIHESGKEWLWRCPRRGQEQGDEEMGRLSRLVMFFAQWLGAGARQVLSFPWPLWPYSSPQWAKLPSEHWNATSVLLNGHLKVVLFTAVQQNGQLVVLDSVTTELWDLELGVKEKRDLAWAQYLTFSLPRISGQQGDTDLSAESHIVVTELSPSSQTKLRESGSGWERERESCFRPLCIF